MQNNKSFLVIVKAIPIQHTHNNARLHQPRKVTKPAARYCFPVQAPDKTRQKKHPRPGPRPTSPIPLSRKHGEHPEASRDHRGRPNAHRRQHQPLHGPVQSLPQANAPEGQPFVLQAGDGVRSKQPGSRAVAHRVDDQRQDKPENARQPRTVQPPGDLHDVLCLGSAQAGVERQGQRQIVPGFFEAPGVPRASAIHRKIYRQGTGGGGRRRFFRGGEDGIRERAALTRVSRRFGSYHSRPQVDTICVAGGTAHRAYRARQKCVEVCTPSTSAVNNVGHGRTMLGCVGVTKKTLPRHVDPLASTIFRVMGEGSGETHNMNTHTQNIKRRDK